MAERYVLLGLAPARSSWFRMVGQWAAAAVLPAEFVRCVSLEELRSRLRSGRAYSAVLIDGGLPGLDRDLIAAATELGCAVLVVEPPSAGRDWQALGAAGTLAPAFSRDELVEVLTATARPIRDASIAMLDPGPVARPATRGPLVAVTGPGGTGASVTAIALAQGLAAEPGTAGRGPEVLLADLCRRADQAMLHDARVLVPGLPELVDAHRGGGCVSGVV